VGQLQALLPAPALDPSPILPSPMPGEGDNITLNARQPTASQLKQEPGGRVKLYFLQHSHCQATQLCRIARIASPGCLNVFFHPLSVTYKQHLVSPHLLSWKKPSPGPAAASPCTVLWGECPCDPVIAWLGFGLTLSPW